MIRLVRLLLLLAVSTGAAAAHAAAAYAPVSQVFLVQNSGWMEPFYNDSRSQFKPLIAAVINAVAEPQERVAVLAFNQAVPGNESPRRIYRGPPGAGLEAALSGVTVATKPRTGGLADTDFQEAVTKTVVGELNSQPGIIWIFTNNKNSPGNSPETARMNREFYQLLHDEPSIVRTLAFPLSMPVRSRVDRANGMMIYALAYGQEAEARLIELVSGRLRETLIEAPARLKPLDQESVAFIPGVVKNAPSVRVGLASDRRTTVLDVDASSRQPVVELTASVENRFYPYVITNAEVKARFLGSRWASDLPVSPQVLTNLAPAASQQVTVSLPIPLVEIPSMWSLTALRSAGKQFSLHGIIELSLVNQQLRVSDAFRTRLSGIFPNDPLPEVFTPSEAVRSSKVGIPVLIRVAYPVYPLLVLGGAVLAAAAVLFGLIALMGGEKRFEIIVDGQPRKIAVKAFKNVQIRSGTGEVIGTVSRTLGKPKPVGVTEGHSISVKA